jgi:hypothetical protein
MLYWTRRKDSSRTSHAVKVRLETNFAGQGGYPYMSFWDGDRYHILKPETIEEVRELQSNAAILALNLEER